MTPPGFQPECEPKFQPNLRPEVQANVQANVQRNIQPELDLERPGIKTYVWEIAGARILIEVYESGEVRVNQSPVEMFKARSVDAPAPPTEF